MPPSPNSHVDATRLALLGRAELTRGADRTVLRFLPERRFRLLAYLAVRGAWVGRDELATLFWPERPQAAARSNLRKLLLEVRALDVPLLESDRDGLRWPIDSDIAQFDAALAGGDIDAALSLYGGSALHGLEGSDSEAFSDWLDGERARRLNAWRTAALAALPQREPAAALRITRALLDADPFDEDAVVAALGARHALGDEGGAAEEYRRYGEGLLEAFGVEPSQRVRHAREHGALRSGRRAGDARAASASGVAAPTSEGFVGRADELRELAELMRNPECRLLTVTGPGGMGKSRLAKEIVRTLAARYADGVLWIALDDLHEVAQVAPRIGAELGLSMAAKQDPEARVMAELAPRQALMVLDNSEHLPSLAPLIERLLDAAPRLQILSTSRARIGVTREWLLPLGGLAVPADDGSATGAADAVRLFVAQAQATQPRFDATANAPQVARLVRALGGLPLAILLAASWVRLLPVAELVNEVTRSLDVLESAEEGEERPEHRSVRATFEQSWRLLAPAEQRALAALSVMTGPFARSQATAVAQAPLPLLAALVDKSLLQVDRAGRFSLHPLIQQFAAEKLALEAAGPQAPRERHAQAYGQFMSTYLDFESVDQTAALAAIGAELSNVLAAWNWAVVHADLDVLRRCCSGLSNLYQARGPLSTGAELFARAHATVELHASAARGAARDATWAVPIERAALHYWLGDYDTVEACARKALLAARIVGHAFATRTSSNTLALVLLRKGQLDEADRLLDEALASAIADKAASEIAAYAGNLVHIKRELGDGAAALRLAHEALAGHRANQHLLGQISMTNELGQIHHGLGAPALAIDWYEEGLRLTDGQGIDLRRAQLLTHMASALLDAHEPARARQACTKSLQVVLQGGLTAHEPFCRRVLARIALEEGALDEAQAQLRAAMQSLLRGGTALAIAPLLRDGALYFERRSDPATALRCVGCADAHRVSRAVLLPCYREQLERLSTLLPAAQRDSALAEGAALSLQAALALALGALDSG